MSLEISFEFFPPKTDKGVENLRQTTEILARHKPQFFSVTYGAGGTTRDRTFETVMDVQSSTGIDAAPHISCIASSKQEILELLTKYKNNNITRLVTLRGDMPSGTVGTGELKYANELVAFIREQTGNHFHIEVAAYPEFHPESPNPDKDLANFKLKAEAGANSALTQYFYNNDAYFYFLDRCEKAGINIPIIPGIMPITNYHQLARFSDACGTEIPRWIRKTLSSYGEDLESIKKFGTEVVTDMCQRLIDQNVPGLHFYTMNQTEPTLAIWNNLSLS